MAYHEPLISISTYGRIQARFSEPVRMPEHFAVMTTPHTVRQTARIKSAQHLSPATFPDLPDRREAASSMPFLSLRAGASTPNGLLPEGTLHYGFGPLAC